MAETKTNSQTQTSDPKLQEFENKIKELEEKKNLISAYVTSYSIDGKFDMSPVIKELKTASETLLKKAKEIRNKEEGGDGKTCTYVKVVRDPEPILTAISPREFTISDIVFYQYTEGYNTEDKQKEKNEAGKTPTKIYKTVKRTFENDDVYKGVEKTWTTYCKIYKSWLTYIDKYEDIEHEITTTKEKKEKYIKKKEEDAYNAKVKAENKAASKEEKAINAVKNKLREYTAGPESIITYKTGDAFVRKFYMGVLKYIDAETQKKEATAYDELKQLAEKVIKDSETVLSTFITEYKKDNTYKCDYTVIEISYKTYLGKSEPLFKEANEKKKEGVKKAETEAKEARKKEKVSDEAGKKAEKKTLDDKVTPEMRAKMEAVDTNGKGSLEGSTGSTEAPSPEGKVDNNKATSAVVKGFTKQQNEEEKQEAPAAEPNKYEDEDKWTDENEAKIKSKKSSGGSSDSSDDPGMDMDMALANVASNLVGAVLTDPSLMQTVNGMASSGTFDSQSLQGMGNAMLASSVNTLTNAMMNTLGVGAIEEMADDALTATGTILTTATNIVPMIKELTVATVTTVTDELTSHVVEKVESILDPLAITTKIQEYTSYYTKQYTMSADDLKKKLLSPGDQAMENEQEEKTEQAKNDKMKNMTQKLADLKNKVQDGVAMAKGGVKMVTTYINNGPDWVIKQLSTYTEFAISQAEKYIDYGADYVIDQRDMWLAQTGEAIGKKIAEKANKKLEQTTKKALDYIEVKKKYATQVAMASIMTAIQIVVSKLGPMLGMALKAGAKMGMKQLLKTIGG